MKYTKIKGLAVTDPDVVNNNFYYIGEGDLLPKSGNSIEPETQELYNIGESNTAWKNIYVQNLSASRSFKTYNAVFYDNYSPASSSYEIDLSETQYNSDSKIYFSADFSFSATVGEVYFGVGFTTGSKIMTSFIFATSTTYSRSLFEGIRIRSVSEGSSSASIFCDIEMFQNFTRIKSVITADGNIAKRLDIKYYQETEDTYFNFYTTSTVQFSNVQAVIFSREGYIET